jgi:hypothetical protein
MIDVASVVIHEADWLGLERGWSSRRCGGPEFATPTASMPDERRAKVSQEGGGDGRRIVKGMAEKWNRETKDLCHDLMALIRKRWLQEND